MKQINTTYTRATIYVLISTLEKDLRTVLQIIINYANNSNSDLNEFIPFEILERAKIRQDQEIELYSIIEYLDFSEELDMISKNKKFLPNKIISLFSTNIMAELNLLSPIRNRVMHARPLRFEDYDITIKAIEYLIERDKNNDIFTGLFQIFNRLIQNPGIVLEYKLPENKNNNNIMNNLPLPDYDDTGFIGREDVIQNIKTICYGPYPVVSILGDGGLGKTALAIEVAYKILDENKNNFQAIIWASSKTTKISTYEITDISNSIRTSLALFDEISKHLLDSAEDSISNILEYLTQFKILLIIDNLETIIDQTIINFLGELGKLPNGSKVLITSRIGLGQFDYPVHIEPLNNLDSVKLLRNYAKIRGVSVLVKTNNEKLKEYCIKMGNNPGFIKWFVATVGIGKSPESVLDNSKFFLEFCMSNVYDYLDNSSREVLNVLLISPKELVLAEISYISEKEALELQKAIQKLITTNMVFMEMGEFETIYRITDFAKNYLSSNKKINMKQYNKFIKRINQLAILNDTPLINEQKYNNHNIGLRNKNDNAVALQLKEVLKAIGANNFIDAELIIKRVIILSPEYYEVQRIYAILKEIQSASSEANEAYKMAIKLSPKSPQLYYFWGVFQNKKLNNTLDAAESFRKAVELDSDAFEPNFELARMLIFSFDFNKAKEIINKLKTLKSNEKNKLLVQYLEMQIDYRLADQALKNCNYSEECKNLCSLFTRYKNIVQYEITNPMKKLLFKSRCFVYGLPSLRNKGTISKELANGLIEEWLYLSSFSVFFHHGQISSIEKDDGYILDDYNEKFYFRIEWIYNESIITNLSIGDDILFIYYKDKMERLNAKLIK